MSTHTDNAVISLDDGFDLYCSTIHRILRLVRVRLRDGVRLRRVGVHPETWDGIIEGLPMNTDDRIRVKVEHGVGVLYWLIWGEPLEIYPHHDALPARWTGDGISEPRRQVQCGTMIVLSQTTARPPGL
jgi:hypothetical protein